MLCSSAANLCDITIMTYDSRVALFAQGRCWVNGGPRAAGRDTRGADWLASLGVSSIADAVAPVISDQRRTSAGASPALDKSSSSASISSGPGAVNDRQQNAPVFNRTNCARSDAYATQLCCAFTLSQRHCDRGVNKWRRIHGDIELLSALYTV